MGIRRNSLNRDEILYPIDPVIADAIQLQRQNDIDKLEEGPRKELYKAYFCDENGVAKRPKWTPNIHWATRLTLYIHNLM